MKKKPAVYTTGERALSRKQAESVIAAARSYEEKLLVLIGFTLGLRRDDLVALRVQDFNTDNGTLVYMEKKKGNRIRTVPLTPRLNSEFKLYKESHIKPDQVYLFPSREKNTKFPYLSSRTAYTIFNDLCGAVGIKTPIPIHSMRATAVKLMQEQGWKVEQTAKIIGDKVETVLQYYATPTDDEVKDLMKEKGGI
jgi:integrase